MSIIVGNIISKNLISLQNTVISQSSQIQQLIDLYSDRNKKSFDQVTKQNIIISYNPLTSLYRFEIEKAENNVFIYQVWKKDNDAMNSSRKYLNISLKDWINNIKLKIIFNVIKFDFFIVFCQFPTSFYFEA